MKLAMQISQLAVQNGGLREAADHEMLCLPDIDSSLASAVEEIRGLNIIF